MILLLAMQLTEQTHVEVTLGPGLLLAVLLVQSFYVLCLPILVGWLKQILDFIL